MRLRLSGFFLAICFCACFALPAHASPIPAPAQTRESTIESLSTNIPGPLRSFLRMAAISQKASLEEVMPLVAHNIVVDGYRGGNITEYLVLLSRYLQQARELVALAGPSGVIEITSCEQSRPLLQILGYRVRQGCDGDASVETADSNRAFLTINSGFPLADLEESLMSGKAFTLPYGLTRVPVLYGSNYWTAAAGNQSRDLIDSLLREPALARLYWAMSRMDTETGLLLVRSPGLERLSALAPELDFFGSHFSVRSGRVVVPGGAAAEPAWRSLVGAGPDAPGEFLVKLMDKDDGWLAMYFDALSYLSQSQQSSLVQPRRLQRLYQALRGSDTSPNPTRHSFRPDQGLFLLVTRLQFGPDGKPEVPGNLDAWKEIFAGKSSSGTVREWGRRAARWTDPEQLLEALFALSRVSAKDSPLQVYLKLSEIDRPRSAEQRLSPQTVRMLAERFSRMGDQYIIFSEFPALDNDAISSFLRIADTISRIRDRALRSDVLGTFQGTIGLWQILARQGQISEANLSPSWRRVIQPFAVVSSSVELYDAGFTSLSALFRAATGDSDFSQDQLIALLAGPNQTSSQGQQVRQEIAGRIRTVMTNQRLIPLDTLSAVGRALVQMGQGRPMPDSLPDQARELREFEMPRPLFSNSERAVFAAGLYNNRHTASQMRTDLVKAISAAGSPAETAAIRGQLASFLRDTLVGLNYAYYEPPGAQMLHNNPLFVRSHDFSGGDSAGHISMMDEMWHTPRLFGRGWTASGGAHLVGSIADLPYVLATVEEDFIIPRNVQSLIWQEMVPGLMTSAVLPRWWGVTRNQLHATTLYQRAGEELLVAAGRDGALRDRVMEILSNRMLPIRSERLRLALRDGNLEQGLLGVLPAETFYLTGEYRRRFPRQNQHWGPAGLELETLSATSPAEVRWERLSEIFGVPHPALTQSNARELLVLKPLPAFMNYSSRLLAESWDSNNLYWARLADEMGYAPEMLNRLIPELTHRMVEETFATHLEDWPALLRAMRDTGAQFREGKIAALPKSGAEAGL